MKARYSNGFQIILQDFTSISAQCPEQLQQHHQQMMKHMEQMMGQIDNMMMQNNSMTGGSGMPGNSDHHPGEMKDESIE